MTPGHSIRRQLCGIGRPRPAVDRARTGWQSILLLSILLSGCGELEPGAASGRPLVIVPTRLSPSDQLGPFRVEEMAVRPETADSSAWSGTVAFTGTVTVSGAYRPHPDRPAATALCFYPDAESAAQLPRFPNDDRVSWFCFANHDDAIRELGGPEAHGEATIVINEYHYRYQPTDTHNEAVLRQVLRLGPGTTEG